MNRLNKIESAVFLMVKVLSISEGSFYQIILKILPVSNNGYYVDLMCPRIILALKFIDFII